MAELVLGRKPVHTVFDLLGRKENDLTYSLGWAFANVPVFLDSVLRDVFETDPGDVEEIILQKVDSGGITDVEVISTRAHLIIEAKRGWVLPTERQFGQYAPRLTATARPLKRLLALTECSNEFASRHLPGRVKGQKVGHRSWSEVIAHAQRATHGVGTHQERHLARQLVRYLKGVTTMQDPNSNIAYCVSLGPSYPEGWPVTPREVLDRGIYFHPFGARWPKYPENFMAFRWDGRIQVVCHVESTLVEEKLHKIVREIPASWNPEMPFLVYRLGPPIPFTPLPAGVDSAGKKINYRDSRFRVAVDLILTSDSVEEAVAKTKARLGEVE